MIHIRRKTY